jgi:hypothetical protein
MPIQKADDKVERTLQSMIKGYPKVKYKLKGGGTDTEQVYGVIYADGVDWIIKFAEAKSLAIVDMGSGVGNIGATIALTAPRLELGGVELNDRYFDYSKELFARLSIKHHMERGNMLRYDKFSTRPTLYFINNERLVALGVKLVEYALDCEPGSYFVTLQRLPVKDEVVTRQENGLGTTKTCLDRMITLVEIVYAATTVDWDGEGTRDFYVYAITASDDPPAIITHTDPEKAADLWTDSAGGVPSSSDESEEDDSSLFADVIKRRRKQQTVKPKAAVKTRFGAYANHRISTIPEGMDDAVADKGQTLDIRVKPVSTSDASSIRDAQTRTASLAMLKAIVFAVTPLLEGWCAGAPDRMVPSLLRWALSETAYTQGTNATTFRTVVRREFGDEVKSLGKAMSKKKKRKQKRRGRRLWDTSATAKAVHNHAKRRRRSEPQYYTKASIETFQAFIDEVKAEFEGVATPDFHIVDGNGWTTAVQVGDFTIQLRVATHYLQQEAIYGTGRLSGQAWLQRVQADAVEGRGARRG